MFSEPLAESLFPQARTHTQLCRVFEVTNALFQITAFNNNIHDAATSAPDLSTARAVQALFLCMPGTTPGIFVFVVFGTTASSRRKLAGLLIPKSWREQSRGSCCFGRRRMSPPSTSGPLTSCSSGIHVQRSLTIASASRVHENHMMDEDVSVTGEISMTDLPTRASSSRSVQISYMKPLPLAPPPPSSRFRIVPTSASENTPSHGWTTTRIRELAAIEEQGRVDDTLTRTITDDSLQASDDCHSLGPEHSDDSGPILPIQRQEVRFSRENSYLNRDRSCNLADGR